MRAAERFFALAVAEHGIQEGDTMRIPMTQCELARRRGVAASTVGAYLSAMGPKVMQRTPDIVLANGSEMPAAEWDGGELLDAYRELTAAQARVIGLLAAARDPRDPREIHRGSRGSDREPRGEVQEVEGEVLLSSLQPSARPRADVADWTDAELDDVLGPLHRAVRLAGLKAMNNRACLASALRPWSLTDIREAVDRLVHDVNRRDTNMRSPFGVLVTWAKSGMVPHVSAANPVAMKADVEVPAEVSPQVRVAVAALVEGELCELDHFVDLAIGASSIRRPAAMQAALRLAYFEQWDSARTPQGQWAHNGRTGGGVS